ncbi:MAG: phospholipase A [Campylobacterota bacterium]|nr:phospholipase A [Campylobacterota bacterium]
MMKKLLVVALLASSVFGATPFEEAYKVYKTDDFKTSLKMFIELVDRDKDYDAAYILGYMYEHGEGCEIDIKKSQEYYKFSSHGYYWQSKPDPSREIKKEHNRIFNSLEQSDDETTQESIRQYTQSLYSIKAHGTTYFLPLSYRYDGSYPDTNGHKALDNETEFQISIKYDFAANLVGLSEVYSIGYTQLSFWQLYADSAYFRETNYNPEAFITLPVSTEYLKAVRVGFAHQSNGRGGVEERSWNYLASSFYFQTGFFFTELKLWKNVFSLKYNPDLIDYLGYGEIQFVLPYKKHILKLRSRNTFSKYRATEVNYSYPLFGSKDLFLYIKGFSGYGESLIDYDNKVHKLGIGFSISR